VDLAHLRRFAVARSLFKELVELNTTESSGSTLAAARAMAARLKSAGFPDSDVVVLENAPKKGNLIARLRGRNTGKKPVMWGPGIVGFDTYHYKYDSGHEGDSCVLGFASRKAAITLSSRDRTVG
jgi:hypothetical protein